MLARSAVASVVRQQVDQLLIESTGDAEPLTDGDLNEIGFNSLLLARLMVQLEDVVGIDPFARGAALADVHSIDDLITVYERAVSQTPSEHSAGEDTDE